MIQFLKPRIATFKKPFDYKFQFDQLPRIASGKIAKKKLRNEVMLEIESD